MFEAHTTSPERSFLKRALLLSLALHAALAYVFPFIQWTRQEHYRSGEVLTLSRVQLITISHRARAVVNRKVAHKATQAKKHVVIVPHIAHAVASSAPARYKPIVARRMEAPSAAIAALAHPAAAHTAPSAGKVAETPAPIASASPAPATQEPMQVAAAPTNPPRQDVGSGVGWGMNEPAVAIDQKGLLDYLKSKLGRVFRVKVHVAEDGKVTDVQFITPSPDEKTQEEIRAAILADVRFDPKKLDGVPYASDQEFSQ